MIQFDPATILRISQVLNAKVKQERDHIRMTLLNESDFERRLSLEIYYPMPDTYHGALILVYTPNSHLQLHHCIQLEIAESLGEVTFISQIDQTVSAIVVEETGGCSFYANIDRALLSGDYQQLGVEVMMSGIGLSLQIPEE
ncbi:MAG: hypothetical protein KBA26_11585 [Candidatus Delongbacteria bacterium]|nr:hypothetical protein [Candidatus Delongbacteria bacterium]